MLKSGLAQNSVRDVSMKQLPPFSTLPQWSRVPGLDKAHYPKSFVKDKLQPQDTGRAMAEDDKQLDMAGMDPEQRAQYLERSLLFLRQQHSDVLRALHGEVEGLKRENKDLQQKVVMIQKAQQQNKSSDIQEERLDDVKIVFLEEEIKELKQALRETRSKNAYMQQLLEQSEESRKRQQATLDSLQQQLSRGAGGAQGGTTPGLGPLPGQFGDSQTLQHSGAEPQTLSEYQALIRHLQQISERQAHELEGLKSDLRDVLYSHKWTPDAYLLAKAYIAEDDRKDNSSDAGSKGTLPKIAPKGQRHPLPELALVQDTVTLPALTQAMGNPAVERRKRTQMLQKARQRRQIVPD